MPPVTRSRDILDEIDGLYFIEQDVIDLAAQFYSELRATSQTFGEDSIERLVPHVSSLFSKLNDMSLENADLKKEVESLQTNLLAAEERCLGLNVSFKEKSLVCCELEDQYDADISNLNNLLAGCREENASLKERLDLVPVDTDRLVLECREKIDTMTAERKCLLTTVEVLEAEIKCLRAELRKAEKQARHRRSLSSDLLSELLEAEATINQTRSLTASGPADSRPPSCSPITPPAATSPPRTPRFPTQSHPPNELEQTFQRVLVIGDSHLRFSTNKCVEKGAFVECCPGGKILDIKSKLLSYLDVSLDLIYFHVGCNNLRRGYRGGPGYNGGHGKREALHCVADLLYTARTQFPHSKIALNSVLIRRDIGYRALFDFNSQLELMCDNFGVTFVEANCCVGRRDLVRDGVHFNRRAVSRLGLLFEDVIIRVLASTLDVPSSGGDSLAHVQHSPTSGSVPGTGPINSSGTRPGNLIEGRGPDAL